MKGDQATIELEINGLTLGKKEQRLSSISLTIPNGEYFGLVGMNGAGKTSLIKAILDFCRPESGSISIRGEDFRQPLSRRNLAFLPERFTPPGHLSAEKFLRRMMTVFDSEYDQSTTLELFEHLAMDPKTLNRPLRKFSKGMTQKVGLIALLMSQRELLILDEPMSGLDPYSRAKMKELLQQRRLEQQPPATLLISSHMLSDVETLCDQIAILHHGVMQFTGSPSECLHRFNAETLEQAYVNCVDSL